VGVQRPRPAWQPPLFPIRRARLNGKASPQAGRSSALCRRCKLARLSDRLHVRFLQEIPNVDLRENQAVLGLLVAIPTNRLAAAALAELLSRRRSCERACEALVRWARAKE